MIELAQLFEARSQVPPVFGKSSPPTPGEMAQALLGTPHPQALLAFWRTDDAWRRLGSLLPADTLQALAWLVDDRPNYPLPLTEAQARLNMRFRDSRAASLQLGLLQGRGLLFFQDAEVGDLRYLGILFPAEVLLARANHLRGPLPPPPPAVQTQADAGLRFYANSLTLCSRAAQGLPVTRESRPSKLALKALQRQFLKLPPEVLPPNFHEEEADEASLHWQLLSSLRVLATDGHDTGEGPALAAWLELSPAGMAQAFWDRLMNDLEDMLPTLLAWARLRHWKDVAWISRESLLSGVGPGSYRWVDEPLLCWLLLLGLLRTGRDEAGATYYGWTELGRAVFDGQPGPQWETGFVLQPNFELLAPLHLAPSLRWALAALAESAGGDPMLRFRLTAPSVRLAVHLGWTGEDVRGFLERGTGPVPDNVLTTLRDWVASAEEPVVYNVPVLALPSERLTGKLLGTTAIRRLLGPQISPTHFFVPSENLPALRKAILNAGYQMPTAMRQLGETAAQAASPLSPGWLAGAPRRSPPPPPPKKVAMAWRVELPTIARKYLKPLAPKSWELQQLAREAAAGAWLVRLQTEQELVEGLVLAPADSWYVSEFNLSTEKGRRTIAFANLRTVQVIASPESTAPDGKTGPIRR